MISCAVKLMPQVGKALPTKKLSDWSGKKSSPSLKFGSSTIASGSLTDCGTTLPSSAAIAVLMATATCAGPVPADEHFSPSPANLAQNLRKPFSVSPPNGTKGCLASIIACTTPVSPPWAVMPSNFLCTAIASAVTFWAVGSSHLPSTSTTSHFLPDAAKVSWMPLWRSVSTEVPATPRTSRILPPSGRCLTSQLAHSTPRPFWSTLTLMASSVSRMLSKATSTTPASLARLMTGAKAVGFCALTTMAS